LKNLFPLAVIALFMGASISCAVARDWSRMMFYLLSALINLNVLFIH
jgi:hypothetical protein